MNIRARGNENQLELLLKHDSKKPGCLDEIIEDLVGITEELINYKNSVKEKKK